jgi:hypothetical protein
MFLSTLQQPPKRKQVGSYSESSLFPVLTAKTLLSGSEPQESLPKIKNSALLPVRYYNEFYQPLISQFAEYAQLFPGQRGHVGGLLIESLRQACLAVQIYYEEATGKIDPLFTYALFSAALLLNVPRLFYKTVTICDKQGIGLSTWFPLEGSLVEKGSHYKVRDYGLRMNPYLRILLASKIMPQMGLRWLTTDEDIFKMWLSVLGANEEDAGMLGLLLSKMRTLFTGLAQDYVPAEVEIIQPEEVAAGEAFFAWLKDELERSPNEAFVHVSERGLVLSEQIFRKFSEAHPIKYADWREVAAQFGKLGFTAELDEQKRFKHEEEFALIAQSTVKNQQSGIFFNKSASITKEEQRDQKAFRDCLIVAEKSLVEKISKNSPKESKQQEEKIRERIVDLVRLLETKSQEAGKEAQLTTMKAAITHVSPISSRS